MHAVMELLVHPFGEPAWRGRLHILGMQMEEAVNALPRRCALGRHGCTAHKREGDGKTPYGAFAMRRLWYRPDRVAASLLPRALPVRAIAPDSIWSDDVRDPDYNRARRAPSSFHHEKLWRDDHLYDAFVELGYNDSPPQPHKGSAIFLHRAAANDGPTEGCIAISWRALRWLMPKLKAGDRVRVAADAPRTAPRQS